MKRIIILTGTNAVAAGSRVMLSWLQRLEAEGFEAHVGFPGGGQLGEALEDMNVATLRLDLSLPRRIWPFGFWLRARRLAEYVKNNDIRLIHCNGTNDYTLGRVAGKWAKVPVACHVHWPRDREYCQWMFGKGRAPDMLFCVSEVLREMECHEMKGLINQDRIVTQYNCIDTESFRPLGREIGHEMRRAWDIPVDSFVVAMPAVIQPRKQQHLLVEMLRKLANEHKDMYLVLAGSASDQTYRDRVERKVVEYGLSSRVRVLGFVKDMAKAYSGFNVTVSLSSLETFGMSAVESLSCGVPMVYFEIPVLQEVVGNAGLAVRMGDVEGLARAVKQLSENTDFYKELVRKGRQRAVDQYGQEASVRRLAERYTDLIETRNTKFPKL